TEVELTYDFGRYTVDATAGLGAFDVEGARFPTRNCVASAPGQSFKIPSEGAQFLITGTDEDGSSATKVVRTTGAGPVDLRLPSDVGVRTVLPAEGATDVSTMP